MNSLSNIHERAEKQNAEQHSEILIEKQMISPEIKLRNFQSQGPYCQNGAGFKKTRPRPLQPPLRFRSVTDQEKFVENHLPENKFNHVVFK